VKSRENLFSSSSALRKTAITEPKASKLALQPTSVLGEGPTAVAKMAQPNAEPVEDYDYESLPPNFSLTQNMAAGAFAGIAEHTVMYPIDAIKTRMQIIHPASSNTAYKGMIESTMRIASGEGVLKLWRGMSSVVVGAGQSSASSPVSRLSYS
jgi:hypothetical protein